MWNVSICRGKLQDLLEILTSKSGIMAEFSKYRFSRKEIDFQPNEVCSDLFHIKVYLTAEYERNRCFSCCHHFSKIFDFWQHSFLKLIRPWRRGGGPLRPSPTLQLNNFRTVKAMTSQFSECA